MEWGELTVFLSKKFDTGSFIDAGVFKCEPGKSLQLHTHEGGDEYCWIFDGTGIFIIDGKEYEVGAGELIKTSQGSRTPVFSEGKRSVFELLHRLSMR